MSVSTFAQSSLDSSQQTQSGNFVINGAFDIWQRGTSFTGTTTGLYTADRWEVRNGTTPTTRTVSRQSFSPGDIESPGIGDAEFYIRNACTGSTSYLRINQRIEDVRKLAGSSVTLSFWARANGGASLQAFLIQNFGAGGSSDVTTNVLDVSAPSSWERVTVTVNLPSMAGKTIGTSSYLYLIIQLSTVTDGNLDIWGVQLEAGTVATPFRRNAPSIQAELAACQRYFEKSYNLATALGANDAGAAVTFYGSSDVSSNIVTRVPFAVQKRTSSYTLNVWGPTGTANVITYNRSGAAANNTAIPYRFSQNAFHVYTGIGASFVSATAEFHWTVSAEL
jgi:hypothetical protein